MPRDERRMTFIVVPHGGGDLSTRSFEVSYRRLRGAALVLLAAALIWVGMAVSYVWVAAQATRIPGLMDEISRLERQQQQVLVLAQALSRLERQYLQVRSMLGADLQRDSSGLRLAPPGNPGSGEVLEDSATASPPPAP